MSFEAKIKCDSLSCCNELPLNSGHPSDAEIELEEISNSGKWLFDHNEENHYCPTHALEAAKELDLEYSN